MRRGGVRAACLLLVVACEPVPPRTMAEVEFPPGFELENSRHATLRLEAAPTVDVARTTLSVTTWSGDPVFEGPASLAVARDLALRLPPGTDRLRLTVHHASRIERDEIPLHGDRVVWTLR